MFGKKTPQDRIRTEDKKIQKLRDKRSKLDSFDQDKAMKINKKIHKSKVEIDIAKRELKQPKTEIKNTTNNVSVSKNDNSKQFHGHFHYHNNGKKK